MNELLFLYPWDFSGWQILVCLLSRFPVKDGHLLKCLRRLRRRRRVSFNLRAVIEPYFGNPEMCAAIGLLRQD
jgi:hypothetical protein